MGPQLPEKLPEDEPCTPKQFRDKLNEIREYLRAVHIEDWQFDQSKNEITNTPSGVLITLKRRDIRLTKFIGSIGSASVYFRVKIDGVYATFDDADILTVDDTGSPATFTANIEQFVVSNVTFEFAPDLDGVAMSMELYGRHGESGDEYLIADYSAPSYTGSFDFGEPNED